jgi:MFS transporter, DHA2 family, lincomycin resistance protein
MSLLSACKLEAGSDLAHASFSGAHTSFIIGAILATLGVVISPFIKVPKQH